MLEYRFTGANVARDGTMLPFITEFKASTDEEAKSVVSKQLQEWRKGTFPSRPHTIGPKLVRIDIREKVTPVEF